MKTHAASELDVDALLRDALARAKALRHLPESTYRLQFHSGFTFADATAISDYLAELGISHCYASPYLRAAPGSTHGYDVIDHCTINPELGGEEGWRQWVKALNGHGLRHILDIVPNHVGVATNDNTWWNDVLMHGPGSKYAEHFDIAWRGSPRPELHEKVLLPVLGSPYGQALENGELTLKQENGQTALWYYDRRFPIDPATLPEGDIQSLNGSRGDPRSFDRLHELLDKQHYRLCYWHVASDEINYRRFFDINSLAALSMEREGVFEATHELILRILAEGDCAGLRIDHPDGLYDPAEYFERLQRQFVVECARQRVRAEDWQSIKPQLLKRLDTESVKNAGSAPPLAALRRRRKDPGNGRAAAGELGGAWHQRIRFPQHRQRIIRGSFFRTSVYTTLRRVHGRYHHISRVGLSEEAADPRDIAFQRTAHAGVPPGSNRAGESSYA